MTTQQEALIEAVANLIKVKGRHNTEIAYRRLITAYDALAQQAAQEPQPVGYFHRHKYGGSVIIEHVSDGAAGEEGVFPLYAAAPAKPAEQEKALRLLRRARTHIVDWWRPDGSLPPAKSPELIEEIDAFLAEAEQQAPSTAALGKEADDLAALVKRLAQALRKAAPDNALAQQATDYLQRKGHFSPLRAEAASEAPATEQAPEPNPLECLHISQGSADAAADAYEAEYMAAKIGTLKRFYGVESLVELVNAQAHHVEKLQGKLREHDSAKDQIRPNRVREG